jgi:hypothetical protein
MSACIACAMDDNGPSSNRPSNIDINESPSGAPLGATFQSFTPASKFQATLEPSFIYGAGNLFATFPRVSRRDSAIMLDRWIFARPVRFHLSPFPLRRRRPYTFSLIALRFSLLAQVLSCRSLCTLEDYERPRSRNGRVKKRIVPRLWNGMERSGPNETRRDKLILVSTFYPRFETERNALREKGTTLLAD